MDFKNNTIDIIIRYILLSLSLSLLYILDNFTFYLVYHLILILTLLIQKKNFPFRSYRYNSTLFVVVENNSFS